ncbi:MAG: hypothetical protein GF403_10270 [Candidatus Coatesbacteria bacterium]|nr:hypothetical protein [Candidatus Coatesbacteria bacterium]
MLPNRFFDDRLSCNSHRVFNLEYEDERILTGDTQEPFYSHRINGSLLGLRVGYEDENLVARASLHGWVPCFWMEGGWNTEDRIAKEEAGVVDEDFSRYDLSLSLMLRTTLSPSFKLGFNAGLTRRGLSYDYLKEYPPGGAAEAREMVEIVDEGSYRDDYLNLGIALMLFPRPSVEEFERNTERGFFMYDEMTLEVGTNICRNFCKPYFNYTYGIFYNYGIALEMKVSYDYTPYGHNAYAGYIIGYSF